MTTCPAHWEADALAVDDKVALERGRIALRDGVLLPWIELGRAPTREETAERLHVDQAAADALLATLEACGHTIARGLLRAPESDLIAVAWPLSNLPTGIVATVDGGKPVSARCAVDALGISAMLGKRVVVDATTLDTREAVRVVVDGTTVVNAAPADLVVFRGKSCDEMQFFSSTGGVDRWKAKQGATGGETFTLSQAVEHGAGVFAPLTAGLAPSDVAVASLSKATPEHVPPWEPVDEAFRGCEGACGSRAQSEEAGVVDQAASAAKLGDRVYCPVSGVVVTVGSDTAKRSHDGRTFYFCCESCAAWFDANAAKVLRVRSRA